MTHYQGTHYQGEADQYQDVAQNCEIKVNWHAATLYVTGRLLGCLAARQYRRSICANCGGGKPAQSAKDGQRDTMHITLSYTITM